MPDRENAKTAEIPVRSFGEDSHWISCESITKEIVVLRRELKTVEGDIAALRETLHGLSLIVGEELFSEEILSLIRPRRKNMRGLSLLCRLLLLHAPHPHSVREICSRINTADPRLLLHQRNPMASVMSVLRHLAKRGEVIRKTENGRSVWQWSSPTLRA
jgi:hypothetical protein